jgi:acyl carrier protein
MSAAPSAITSKLFDSVYKAIEEFNQLQEPDRKLQMAPETVLLGANGVLDSLGLVNLLVTVEQQVSTDFGRPVTLASEKAFSMRNSPFATVQTLVNYLAELVEEEAE